MGTMVNRNVCRRNLILVLASLAVLAGFQPTFSESRDIEEIRISKFRQLAEQGDTDAQLLLGLMYAGGHGVPQNTVEAVKWYRMAAEQGDAEAQYNLGFMYDEGRGVPENDEEAAKWYQRAAEQGNADAQYGLAFLQLQGCLQAEADWIQSQEEAVEQGSYLSGWKRGTCNLVKAYAWVLVAAAKDHQLASDGKDSFTDQMTGVQIFEAQKLAAEIWARIESSKSQ